MARKPYTAKKYQGDDKYSWAVFHHGRPVMTGMDRSQAQWYAKKYNDAGTHVTTEEDRAARLEAASAVLRSFK